ncbi:Hypothetical predicted protein [Mytilus galloprovincialis]|uniref:Uncharacterized protein n=1 Tax=Mytilus galloprovincialis TaxID=29158 RepID=A0A8B6FGW6_MYTGA|nr:Hypothetical predicted protein [Mytilus galloprovincialis]
MEGDSSEDQSRIDEIAREKGKALKEQSRLEGVASEEGVVWKEEPSRMDGVTNKEGEACGQVMSSFNFTKFPLQSHLKGGNTGIQPIVKSNFALDFIFVENSSSSLISSTMELRDVESIGEMVANDGHEVEDDDVMVTEVAAEVEEDAIFKTEAEVKAGTDVGAGSDVKLRIGVNV